MQAFICAAVFMLVSTTAFAQTGIVSGTVLDNTGVPIIGAAVIDTQDRSSGALTDIDGNFSISVNIGTSLEISYLGFQTITVPVTSFSQMNIVMEQDSEYLDEVVVIGYGTVRKRDLTGAVSSVSDRDIKDAPVSNVGQALQGKVSGVYIVDAAKPGDNVSIKIRGLGTINDSDPLVVIDGVPTDLGLSSLNTADIDRIDVLKDASATAIYGSRGANGVVMVTTKRGQSGEGKLNVSANWAMQNVAYVPEMLNASEYAAYSNDMLSAAGLSLNPEWSRPESLGEGTDWLDEMFQTGFMQRKGALLCVRRIFGPERYCQDHRLPEIHFPEQQRCPGTQMAEIHEQHHLLHRCEDRRFVFGFRCHERPSYPAGKGCRRRLERS